MQLERLLRPDADGRVRGGSPPAGDHGLPRLGAGDRRGRTPLVLRLDLWALHQDGGLFTVLMCIDCQAARGHGGRANGDR